MSSFAEIPVKLECVSCSLVLLEAHVDVELLHENNDIHRAWLLVDSIHIKCPQCGILIVDAADDFTRVLNGIGDLGDEGV